MSLLQSTRFDWAEPRRQPFSVLFLCTANVCRSPAAQCIFQRLVDRRGLSHRFVVSSAGTSTWKNGVLPDYRMRWEAFRRGYLLQNRSRQLGFHSLKNTNLVVAMSHRHIQDAQRINRQPDSEFCLLTEFLDSSWPDDVPDPINRSPRTYRLVLDMIENACEGILEHCLQTMLAEHPSARSRARLGQNPVYATQVQHERSGLHHRKQIVVEQVST